MHIAVAVERIISRDNRDGSTCDAKDARSLDALFLRLYLQRPAINGDETLGCVLVIRLLNAVTTRTDANRSCRNAHLVASNQPAINRAHIDIATRNHQVILTFDGIQIIAGNT